jgi:EAL domain-containing protein (putative c-di-GMP-specific phosphodiesterase class I)
VETEDQSKLLRLLHCDENAGVLFSKPAGGDFRGPASCPIALVSA